MPRISALFAAAAATAFLPLPAVAGQTRSMLPPETLATALQRQDTMFARMDQDGDGFVTTVEIEAGATAMRAGRRPDGAGPPPGAQPRSGPGGARGGFMQRMMQEADGDGDGRISRDEMRTQATARFQAADKDGDGVLSAQEQSERGFGRRPAAPVGDPTGAMGYPPEE